MRDRPSVLIVVTLAEIGGAQTYVAQLLPALATEFDVTVAAWGPGPLRDAAERAGVRFVALRHVRRPISPLRDLLGLLELAVLCRRLRPDVVHANSSKAGVLARLAAWATGVRARIFTAHGWAFAAHHGAASKAYLWADRAMRPLTTTTICVAENERRIGIEARTCAPARTVVIANAVDVAAAPLARPGDGPPVVVSVGRLQHPKDSATLLRAAARLGGRDWRLELVGDGPDRPALESLHRELGLEGRVRFAGERDDVPELLSRAAVFVLSSRSEGMPLSVLEAMAAGLPVVASRVGGIPEQVADGVTGLLVPVGDAERLAEALRRLLDDPELRRSLGSAGRTRAEERFDLATFRAAHLDVYRRCLA